MPRSDRLAYMFGSLIMHVTVLLVWHRGMAPDISSAYMATGGFGPRYGRQVSCRRQGASEKQAFGSICLMRMLRPREL